MHYISPLGLNWYASCSLQTDVVQQRGKSENLFKIIQVLSAIARRAGPLSILKLGKMCKSVEIQERLIQQAFHQISHQNTRLPSRSSAAIQKLFVSEGEKKKERINKPTLIVKHFSAVPASWTSMKQNSNAIFPLITHARSSGAINWFWELSSIFNPSSGSAGRVKTSLKTRTRAEFGTFKVQAEAWKTCWQLMEPIQPRKPFNASHPGGDICQCPSLAVHLWQAQRKAAEVRKDPAGWCVCVYMNTHELTGFWNHT